MVLKIKRRQQWKFSECKFLEKTKGSAARTSISGTDIIGTGGRSHRRYRVYHSSTLLPSAAAMWQFHWSRPTRKMYEFHNIASQNYEIRKFLSAFQLTVRHANQFPSNFTFKPKWQLLTPNPCQWRSSETVIR